MKKGILCALLAMMVITGGEKVNASENNSEVVTLTVATNNIDAKAQPDVEAESKLLDDNGVEIAGLQEVDNLTIRNNYDVADKFKGSIFKDAFFSNAIAYEGGEYGIATVSKYEFKSKDTVKLYSDLFAGEDVAKELEEAYRNYVPGDEEAEEKMSAVSAKNPVEPRVYQRTVIEKEGKEIAFYNTHLSWENMELRKQQMEALKKAMDEDSCDYVVAVGDFNADQSTKEFSLFADGYVYANGLDGKWLDTYTGEDDSMNVNSIDNIIVSKNITVQDVKTVSSELSDHNPLVATLLLND